MQKYKLLCTFIVLIAFWEPIRSDSSNSTCDLKLTRPCRSNSSLCVALEHINDGFVDCPDGSDEDCESGSFICKNLQGCFPIQKVQDGSPDCDDESDEECEESQHECLCGFPRCIDKSKVGDGILDCVEGSDELAIEKDSYICPPDLLVGQEIFRKRRHIGGHDVPPTKPKNSKVITNFFALRDGITMPTGVLTSTVDSFINKGVTSEYLTHIRGQTIGRRYAQVTSYQSRTFFVLPTKLNVNQVDGLVSSIVRTTVVGKATHTLVSRIYHTYIDGAYAQLVETETLKHSPQTKNYVTVLQGEELQGTFVSNPSGDLKTLSFSHLEGSLNPEPVAGRIVTVTGTKGQFIKEGTLVDTTFTVFTGSYMKGDKTYVFFIGNSALPSGGSAGHNHFEETFLGEGTVDGHKVGGVFREKTMNGHDSSHVHTNGGTKMLTVTIGEPTMQMALNTKMPKHNEMKISDNLLFENEMENELPTARKIPDSIVLNNIVPSKTRSVSLPTFVVNNPNQNLGDIIDQEMGRFEEPVTPKRTFPFKREQNIVEDIRKQFNIDTDFIQSDLPTVTYYGFAEFTTTIANTVVIFSPNSQTGDRETSAVTSTKKEMATARVVAPTSSSVYSTATTTVYNTVDLYPSGLVSSIGGTLVRDDMTTLFTTLVYGTYISGQYAQVVRSTSSIYYLVSRSASPEPTATQPLMIKSTASPELPSLFAKSTPNDETATENMFDSIFNDISDNTIGRSVSGNSKNQIITDDTRKEGGKKVLDAVLDVHPTITTYTLYSTFVNDGKTTISTTYRTTTAAPEFKIVVLSDDPQTLSTLTYHTTELISGTTSHTSSLQVLTNKVEPTTRNDFFDLFPALSNNQNENTEESFSEMTTESSMNDSTDGPGLLLESSLNGASNIEAQFFPRTYYTTYTYFTTYHSLDASSVVSSLKTITNVVSDANQLSNHQAATPIVPTYPVTYWTTFTYWTTLVKDNTSFTTSTKKTVSSVVQLTGTDTGITSIRVTAPSEAIQTSVSSISELMSQRATTYYTTYTMYTTAIKGTSTLITSVLKTDSSIVTGTLPILDDGNDIEATVSPSTSNVFDVFGFLTESKSSTLSKTGLLSTLRGSTVIDGTTTMFSTNVYGSYVDGLYVQIQSTTSQVKIPVTATSTSKGASIVTADIGKTIANEVTTYYTTQHVVKMINGNPVTNILSTSSYGGNLANVGIPANPTMTGTAKEIIGSIIKGTKTTYYHTSVIGTVVAGVYAQKVDSTSRLVSGPSRTFDIISESDNDQTASSAKLASKLESSLNLEPSLSIIEPTAALQQTKKKETKKTTGKNRLSFPIRTRKRNEFAFIRRTSTFERAGLLTKGLFAAPIEEKTTEEPSSQTTGRPIESKPFRFGSEEPKRKAFRFRTKFESTTEKKTTERNPPEKPTTEKAFPLGDIEDVEKPQTQRPFRFANRRPAGTRSSLPFVRERRPSNNSPPKSSSRFRFDSLLTTTDAPTTEAPTTPARQRSNPRLGSRPRLRISPRFEVTTSKPETTTTAQSDTNSRRSNLFAQLSRPGRKPLPQRRPTTFRATGVSQRRRPTIPRFRKEESQIEPVYVDLDGSEIEELSYYDLVPFTADDVLSRKKRQANSFGSRTNRRGSRRFSRPNINKNAEEPKAEVSPTPSEEPKQFTISNPRFIRARGRNRNAQKSNQAVSKDAPKQSTPVSDKKSNRGKVNRHRATESRSIPRPQRGKQSKPKSRTSLPFRPRRPQSNRSPKTSRRSGFRRPSTDSRLRVSSRFNPKSEPTKTTRRQMPTHHSRNRVPGRKPPSKSPTQLLLERPKPPPKPEPGAIIKEPDGSLSIVQELTVTREVPVTTTIPLLEEGLTVEKEVITASYTTEVIFPDQITQTEIDGHIKLLLSTVENEMKVTQVFIQPFSTTMVTYTPTFIDGRRTSKPHILPTTIFSIVTVTTNQLGGGNGVNDILKLFLLQQQQQNPLLAALGLGGQQKPNTYLKTSVYTTTVTNFISTEIPIIFRGKTIKTTVVDSQVEVITTTDITTETLSVGGLGPINPLLPLLIQNRQKREIQYVSVQPELSTTPEQNMIKVGLFYDKNQEPLLGSIQPDSMLFDAISKQSHIETPTLELKPSSTIKMSNAPTNPSKTQEKTGTEHFLWETSAELPPLKRNKRSAQRGRSFRLRTPGGRAIDNGNNNNEVSGPFRGIGVHEHFKPTTYFTTFTYYTTLVDNKGREFIRSSEETITQIKTHGNVQFDDFTKTSPSKIQPIVSTALDDEDYFLTPEQESDIDEILNEDIIIKDPVEDKQTTTVGLIKPVTVLPLNEQRLIPEISNRRRVRITVTKKRTVDMSKPADIVDKTTIDNDGRKRIVITRRLPRPQPTAVASPINPYVGTVSTLYTVYSYLYTMTHNGSPEYYSTRLVTASNSIEPTLVTVPEQFREQPTSSLLTIEQGISTATLGDRFADGITTQIYLASATLAQVRPQSLTRGPIAAIIENTATPDIGDLLDIDITTESPSTTQASQQNSLLDRIRRLRQQSRNRGSSSRPSTNRARGSARFTTPKTTTTTTSFRARRPSPSRRQPSRSRGSTSNSNTAARRRPSRITTESSPTSEIPTTSTTPLTPIEEPVVTQNAFSLDDFFGKIVSSDSVTVPDVTTESSLPSEKPIRIPPSRFHTRKENESPPHRLSGTTKSTSPATEPPTTELATEPSIDTDILDDEDYYYYYYYDDDLAINETDIDIIDSNPFEGFFPIAPQITPNITSTTENPILTSSTTEQTEIEPTKSSEIYIEEETIKPTFNIFEDVYETFTTSTFLPILGGEQSITLTLLTSTLRTQAPSLSRVFSTSSTPSSTPSAFIFDTTTEPSSILIEQEDDALVPKGRAVASDDSNQQLLRETGRGIGAQLSIVGRPDLSTKTMDNGVQVIVADETPKLPAGGGLRYKPSNRRKKPAITLPPSTLLNQMVLVPSKAVDTKSSTNPFGQERVYQVNTFYTTFTYYNTMTASDGPLVVSSTEVVSNVVSSPLEIYGNYIENTKYQLETRTYFTTQTFTRTIGSEENPKTVSSEEIITQVIVTEAPTVSRSSITPLYSTLVTKTYFTTYTYFSTITNGGSTTTDTNTVISSTVVTETGGIITSPSLPQISKSLIPMRVEEAHSIYATKTYFTTSTYLTTILENGVTVTSSRIEVASNIVTEPIYSSLNDEQLASIKASYSKLQNAYPTLPYESVGYIPLGKDVYKELKTLYATYTHFTTLPVGEVISREVTKTNVLTTTITTQSVPLSLIVPDSGTSDTQTTSFQPGGTLQLDPSYLDINQQSTSVVTPKKPFISQDSNKLKATVMIEEGSEKGTMVVKDSVTSATLLVRPTDETITKTQNPFGNLFDSIFDSSSNTEDTVPDIKTDSPTSVLTVDDPELATRIFADLTTEPTEEEHHVKLADLPKPTRADTSNTGSDSSSSDSVSSSAVSPANNEEQSEGDSSVGGFGLSLAPMLTAVAGIIGNTFVGRLAGQADNAKRKKDETLLPTNAIVAANQEPNFIPVGSMGASRNNEKETDHLEPEHGFIPLHESIDVQSLPHEHPVHEEQLLHFAPESPLFQPSMEKFGPSFRPPLVTETGFTAMTSHDFHPTRVSVISGEETIFFDGVDTFNAQVNHHRPISGPVQVPFPRDLLLSPSNEDDINEQNINREENSFVQLESSQTAIDGNGPIETDIFDQFWSSANSNGDGTLGALPSSIHAMSESPEIIPRSTLVVGDSTLLSGKTTIYDSLFTKPANEKNVKIEDITSLHRGANGRLTKYITHTRFAPQITTTETVYKSENTVVTKVVETTLPPRTLITTIVGFSTHISTVTVNPSTVTETVHITPFTAPSSTDEPVTTEEAETIPEGFIPNEANLAYAEENEISSIIESQSPDQHVVVLHRESMCTPECSSNELCRSSKGENVCVCKPGFGRRIPTDQCTKINSYQLNLALERMNDNKLRYSPELSNRSHPSTQYLAREIAAGVDRAIVDSEIGEKYQSNTILAFEKLEDDIGENTLIAKVKIDLVGEASEDVLLTSFIRHPKPKQENLLKFAIQDSLRHHNYSLGGTEIYARQKSTILDASDFDECSSPEHNDCHADAHCINIVGSFLCKCNDNFKDMTTNEQNPGRECIGYASCSFCNYHGQCIGEGTGEPLCECDDWFSGEQCQINMKVMLIVVVSLGAFLLLLFCICLGFCLLRTKKNSQNNFLAGRMVQQANTLDRRAMIGDSTSESSEDISRIPGSTMSVGVHTTGRRPKTGNGKHGVKGIDNPTLPHLLIPRVKGYQAPARPDRYQVDAATSRTRSQQAVLVDILDGGPRPTREQPVTDFRTMVQSSSRDPMNLMETSNRSRRHSLDDNLENIVDTPRSRSSSRPRIVGETRSTVRSKSTDRFGRNDGSSEFGANSLRYGNRTVSEVRSYDETTVRVPIRSFRGESIRSRDVSSQILSEGVPTNAERDGASTIVYPQTQLYRPVRETDSLSDLTTGNHRYTQDYFD